MEELTEEYVAAFVAKSLPIALKLAEKGVCLSPPATALSSGGNPVPGRYRQGLSS